MPTPCLSQSSTQFQSQDFQRRRKGHTQKECLLGTKIQPLSAVHGIFYFSHLKQVSIFKNRGSFGKSTQSYEKIPIPGIGNSRNVPKIKKPEKIRILGNFA